jgi:elongation factor 2
VEPLEEKVIGLIDKGEISEEMNRKQTAAILQKEGGWSMEEAGNVWVIEDHKNMLIDMTKGVQYLHEARDMIISGFRWGCENGPLAEESMRGVKVKLMNAQLHEDPVYRGPAQIMPATRRAMFGSFLTAKPVLLEPIYKIGVSVPSQYVGDVSSILTRNKGRILSSEQKGPLTMISGYIPVAQTFGLATDMRSATSGHAFWQSTFDHWEKTPENIALAVIKEMRKRRGLPPEIPTADKFIDEA